MATYVVSDIHGEYDMFLELLDKIGLKETDTLYVLGDILDRGPHPLRLLRKLMEMPNVVCLVGNHELMALECLEFLCKEITEESIDRIDSATIENLLSWQGNGGTITMDEFHRLDKETQEDIIEFLGELLIYEELTVNGRDFLLVHAGLGNYSPGKEMDEYSLKELVWDRADYETQYFDDGGGQGIRLPSLSREIRNRAISTGRTITSPSTASATRRGEGWRRSALTPGKNSIPRQMAAEIG